MPHSLFTTIGIQGISRDIEPEKYKLIVSQKKAFGINNLIIYLTKSDQTNLSNLFFFCKTVTKKDFPTVVNRFISINEVLKSYFFLPLLLSLLFFDISLSLWSSFFHYSVNVIKVNQKYRHVWDYCESETSSFLKFSPNYN